MNHKRPQILDLEANRSKEYAVWDWLKLMQRSVHPDFTQTHLVWHLTRRSLAVHNIDGLYLTTPSGDDVCKVDLAGKWVLQAQWSPDGRYLALRVAKGLTVGQTIRLLILDTYDGSITPILSDLGNIFAMAWAPDGKQILVVTKRKGQYSEFELNLVEVISGNTRRILDGYHFHGPGSASLFWSPKGDSIVIHCPVIADGDAYISEGRLCIIQVEKK